MSTHKSIDRICIVAVILTLVVGILFCNGQAIGIEASAHVIGYENRLFDNSKVHSFDIVIDDWDAFLSTCESEEYTVCNVVIDGEAVRNVGIRGKGNTSLSSVKSMNSNRYSFKIEFDQYDSTKTYHGLDKLCLNNVIQDNTYMKDYIAYTLMYNFGVDAPLCSFVYITVNGEDWGLYLAVEAVEDTFLQRNYGNDYGELYKPDSMSFGGGRGNGKEFNMSEFIKENSDDSESTDGAESGESSGQSGPTFSAPDFGNGGGMPDFGGDMSQFDPSNMPEGFTRPDSSGSETTTDGEKTERSGKGGFGGFGGFGGGFGMGSDDVKLKYIDDDTDSYSNIFNNAKTDVSKADKNRLIRSLKSLSEQTDIENTVDVDEVIRYFVVHNFLQNSDSYTGMMIHNYYLYEKDGQLSMIPWDYNLAFGSFSGNDASGSVNSPIDTPVSGGMSDRPMISWIFDSEEYTELYHKLFSEFINSVDLEKLIDDTAAMIDSYVQKDPTKFCTYEEYQKGVAAIKSFCTLRAESVKGQLDGTIPSTSSGQQADSSALIDTGDLVIADMGSMSGGNGGFGGGNGGDKAGFGNFGRGGRSKDSSSDEQSSTEQTAAASSDAVKTMSVSLDASQGFDPSQFGGNMPDGFDPSQMPGGGFGGGNMPEGFDPSQFGGGNMPDGFTPPNGRPDETKASDDNAVTASSEQTETAETTEKPSETKSPDKSGDRSGSPQMGSFPQMNGGSRGNDSTGLILLGVSALCLILGIVFAAVFKR